MAVVCLNLRWLSSRSGSKIKSVKGGSRGGKREGRGTSKERMSRGSTICFTSSCLASSCKMSRSCERRKALWKFSTATKSMNIKCRNRQASLASHASPSKATATRAVVTIGWAARPVSLQVTAGMSSLREGAVVRSPSTTQAKIVCSLIDG